MLRTLAFKAVQPVRYRKGPSSGFIILVWIAHDQAAALTGGIYTQIGVHPVALDDAFPSRPQSRFDGPTQG